VALVFYSFAFKAFSSSVCLNYQRLTQRVPVVVQARLEASAARCRSLEDQVTQPPSPIPLANLSAVARAFVAAFYHRTSHALSQPASHT
jgi:hypothetical protein